MEVAGSVYLYLDICMHHTRYTNWSHKQGNKERINIKTEREKIASECYSFKVYW